MISRLWWRVVIGGCEAVAFGSGVYARMRGRIGGVRESGK